MTVKELRAALDKLPADAVVTLEIVSVPFNPGAASVSYTDDLGDVQVVRSRCGSKWVVLTSGVAREGEA
jgi:hypothetical protein